MRRVVRENALCALLAAAGCATMAWLGLYGYAWTDYDTEARPAFEALGAGHVLGFLRALPAYGGSLIERAPFALVPQLWGGGQLAVYRMVALPCLLASALLGMWLLARMRRQGSTTLARAVVLGLCVANPVTLLALELGHPEELLGAVLCVAALLLAASPPPTRRRAIGAGVVLGLAVANKEWALLALGPVLLVLPARQRLACLLGAGAGALVVLAPAIIFSAQWFGAGTTAIASSVSPIFQPWQVFWFFGHHGALVHGTFGNVKPGYRTAPAWTGLISHPLIILAGLAIGLALWARRRRLDERQALLALALLLLLRCVLDTWDAAYYPLPFIFALMAWELDAYNGRPPVLALCATVLVWVSFQWLPEHASADVQAAFFLAWTLPLAGWLGAQLYAGTARSAASTAQAPAGAAGRAQGMTVSALGKPVRTS